MTITAWGIVAFVLLPAALLCRVVTIWGAARMLQGKSYGMSVTSSITAMVPCSPLWLISLPLGLWSLVTLTRSQVKAALTGQQMSGELTTRYRTSDLSTRDSEQAPVGGPELPSRQIGDVKTDAGSNSSQSVLDFIEVESDLNGPSVAMIVIGLLTVAGHIFTIVMCLGNEIENAPLGVPGVFIGLAMFAGGLGMRRLASRGWAQFGVVAGLIPASLGWIITAAVSIWTINVLNKPHVRRAFIERARQRRDRETAPVPTNSAKSGQGLGGAILLTVLQSVLWLALFLTLVFLVPQCQRVFDDFDVELPAVSVRMIVVSYAVINYWYLIVPLGIIGMALHFVFLLLLAKVGRRVQSIVGVLLALVPLLLGAAVFLALWLPLTKLLEGLS